jgi:hypothetical protein
MFTFANVLDFLVDKFTGLRRGRLALPFGLTGTLQRFSFGHTFTSLET